jgi:hypothetical protein
MPEDKPNLILVIEMKSKHLNSLLEQLNSTGYRLIQMKSICFQSEDLSEYLQKIFFFAVANGASSRQWGRLTSRKVTLNGKNYPIITLKCGEDPFEKLKGLKHPN